MNDHNKVLATEEGIRGFKLFEPKHNRMTVTIYCADGDLDKVHLVCCRPKFIFYLNKIISLQNQSTNYLYRYIELESIL